MSRSYPRIDSRRAKWAKPGRIGPRCDVAGCEHRAVFLVDIQCNWFRGDDEVAHACQLHKGDDSIHALLAGIEARRQANRAREAENQTKAAERRRLKEQSA